MVNLTFMGKTSILDFMLNITTMNIGIQTLLGYAYCMIEHRKCAATNSYDTSKLLKNSYVMEWISSLPQY